MDLRTERDIEQLRRIALAQKVPIERLLKVLAAQSKRVEELTGGDGEPSSSTRGRLLWSGRPYLPARSPACNGHS